MLLSSPFVGLLTKHFFKMEELFKLFIKSLFNLNWIKPAVLFTSSSIAAHHKHWDQTSGWHQNCLSTTVSFPEVWQRIGAGKRYRQDILIRALPVAGSGGVYHLWITKHYCFKSNVYSVEEKKNYPYSSCSRCFCVPPEPLGLPKTKSRIHNYNPNEDGKSSFTVLSNHSFCLFLPCPSLASLHPSIFLNENFL